MKKKLLSFLMVFVLLLTALPAALAEEVPDVAPAVPEEQPAPAPEPFPEPAPAPGPAPEPEPAPAPEPVPAVEAAEPAPEAPAVEPAPEEPAPEAPAAEPAPEEPVPDMPPESEDNAMTLEEILGINPADWPKTMYVFTQNRGTLKVRSEPNTGNNVIGKLEYGAEVIVEGPVVINADWSVIRYSKGKDGIGYVMTRYLVDSRPKDTDKVRREKQNKQTQAEIDRQVATVQPLATPLLIAVRATRTSGWINFRNAPGTVGDRIASLPDGRQLKAIGETTNWYEAIDSESGKTGYISKNYVIVLGTIPEEKPAPAKEEMGKLTVNGEFSIQAAMPEGYSMQVLDSLGTRINALITSPDVEKPVLMLFIAFDDLYSDVDRMNDLSEEDLKILEDSFTELNDVNISYRETAYGTKLLIARETGADADFVDILSVYKGYFVEFVMSPNPEAQNQTLSDAQVQMCIDFLSEVDFVPAN